MNLLKTCQENINNPSFILKVIFWALVAVFALIVGYITIPIFRRDRDFYFVIVSGIIFFLLGITLIFLPVKERMDRLLKKFLVLKRASAKGIFHYLFTRIFENYIHIFITGKKTYG